MLAPPNLSEIGAPQEELDAAFSEAFVLQPLPQSPRTKLIFDVVFEDNFLG